MDVLINGNMNEANTRRAEIENVEVEDFIRFCEYAYRGDFTVPTWKQDETSSADGENPGAPPGDPELEVQVLPDEMPSPPPPPVAEPEPEAVVEFAEDDWSQGVLWGKKKRGLKDRLRYQFQNRIYESDDPKREIVAKFDPYTNDAANQDFTPVFLAYARLYTFAHFRCIEPLKALTLHKLHSTLKGFKLYRKRVGDIIKLAEYAYTADDLPSRGEDGTVDALRQLVVEYIGYEISTIGKCREFVDLMEAGGEFVGDFWEITKRYLI
jgi:hypothetical protein